MLIGDSYKKFSCSNFLAASTEVDLPVAFVVSMNCQASSLRKQSALNTLEVHSVVKQLIAALQRKPTIPHATPNYQSHYLHNCAPYLCTQLSFLHRNSHTHLQRSLN